MVQYLGNLVLSSRWGGKFPVEIQEQKVLAEVLLVRGFQLQNSPRRGRSWETHLLGPALLSPAQWPDCVLGADVSLRAAAQKGFSAGGQWQIYAGPTRCAALALARAPAAGNLPGGEGCSVCRDTRGLSRLLCKCQNGVGCRQLEGSAAASWEWLEITPRGETERLACWRLQEGGRASSGQDIPSLS